MRSGKKANLVIALLCAIGLWAYVLGEINPTSTEIIRSIPITFVNQASLEEEGLVLYQEDTETVNITFSGQRTATSKVKASDFRVTCDLEGLGEGTHTIELSILGPDGVKIESVSEKSVTVIIDKYVTAEKYVVPIKAELPENSVVVVTEKDISGVNVSGPETQVSKVAEIHAVFSCAELEAGETELTVELTPVDKNGNRVHDVTLSRSSVILKVKTTVYSPNPTQPNANTDDENTVDDNTGDEGDIDPSDTDQDPEKDKNKDNDKSKDKNNKDKSSDDNDGGKSDKPGSDNTGDNDPTVDPGEGSDSEGSSDNPPAPDEGNEGNSDSETGTEG